WMRPTRLILRFIPFTSRAKRSVARAQAFPAAGVAAARGGAAIPEAAGATRGAAEATPVGADVGAATPNARPSMARKSWRRLRSEQVDASSKPRKRTTLKKSTA